MPHLDGRSAMARAAAMLEAGADLGFAPAAGDAPAALALAARLMNCQVACAASVSAAIALQPAAAMVLRQLGRPVGVVATLLLAEDQRAALISGDFDGLAPRADRLCGPQDAPSIYYIWGVAGESRAAKWAAMELCRRFRYGALADLTAFTRVATADGRRAAVSRLGFVPAGRADDNLLISPPTVERRAA